ncbi:MAG: hypothetical protein KKA65_03575 [Nanoarchaeota archaeon]|nr:hypothetical protein [Nanoarchaeota archaeon]MBU4241686.1 hypothetical protein [Nanoarchaeota archaeon]MBU4351711.1 hypothetical protein [Nanoarchaeota archaeon]MBU4456558.1 hypothetical protein [Nanoarchaeota archaeon]MCG2719935.1 hypothetical protein [Nanoarchaeota archaeon]
MKRYKAKIERNRLENTLKLTFERIPVKNVVEMYMAWSQYSQKQSGILDTISWSGILNNPIEVWKTYNFKCLDMKISSKRYRYDEKLQTVELFFSGDKKLDGVVHDVMGSFFSKYLKSMPE